MSGGRPGLWSVEGPGVLAREGDLVLLSSLSDTDLLDRLLDLLTDSAGAGGDGLRFAQAVEDTLEKDGSWRASPQGQPGPALVAFGPAGTGLAVAVTGAAWVEITTVHGTQRIVAGQPSMLLRCLIATPVMAVYGGLGGGQGGVGRTDRFSRLDAGVVRAGGLSYHVGRPSRAGQPDPAAASPAAVLAPAWEEPRAAVPNPAEAVAEAARRVAQAEPAESEAAARYPGQARFSAEPVAEAEVTAEPAEPAYPAKTQFSAEPVAEARVTAEPASPGASPAQQAPRVAGYSAETEFAADVRYQGGGPAAAPPAPPAPPVPHAPAPPAPAPSAPAPSAPAPAASAPPAPVPSAPAPSAAEAAAGAGAAVQAEPDTGDVAAARAADRETDVPAAEPFDSVLLTGEEPAGLEERPPLPLGAEPSEEARSLSSPVQILGAYCKNGHFDDPEARYCAVCGISMNQQTLVPRPGPRPPLGLLVLDGGAVFQLDADYVIGREPTLDSSVAAGKARPLRIADSSGTVSRAHAKIELEGWHVFLYDLGSANGTRIRLPNQPADQQLTPRTPVRLLPGSHVDMGGAGFHYESHRGR
jgi:hypothetical protein